MPLSLPPPKATAASSSNNGPEAAPPAGKGALSLPAPSVGSSASGSESDAITTSAPDAPLSMPFALSAASSSSSSRAPPPKTKAKTAGAGPKKFVLDLPKPSNGTRTSGEALGDDTNGEIASAEASAPKRPRLEGKSGLSALLPEPTKPPIATGRGGGFKLPAPRGGSLAIDATTQRSTSMVPHTVGKGKGKASAAATEQPAEVPSVTEAEADAEPELDFFGLGKSLRRNTLFAYSARNPGSLLTVPPLWPRTAKTAKPAEPAVDFFGFGASSDKKGTAVKAASVSATPIAKPSVTVASSAPKFSAAPTTSAPDLASNYYATVPLPTPKDPYPGFYQRPDGSWAAKRPDEWEIWMQAHTEAQAQAQQELEEQQAAAPASSTKRGGQMPSDFDAAAIAESSVDVRAALLRAQGGEADTRPSKIPEEDRLKMEADKAKAQVGAHTSQIRGLPLDRRLMAPARSL